MQKEASQVFQLSSAFGWEQPGEEWPQHDCHSGFNDGAMETVSQLCPSENFF